MASKTNEKSVAQASNSATAPPQKRTAEETQLQCPRCESWSTKFCYYNNYNLSQPRHFCKSCRRYWTQGGALRNVPVGGGSRKSSSKRRCPRSNLPASCSSHSPANSSSSSPVAPTSSSALSTLTHEPQPLTISGPEHIPGVDGGNGLYMGLGFPESGFGFNAALRSTAWPTGIMGTMGFVNFTGTGSSSGPSCNNGWKLFSDVEVGGAGSLMVDGGGDSFAWSDLTISTPGGGATLK